MRKIGLLLEYDGTAYHGWQIQKKGVTIQGILEEKIIKIMGKQSRVIGASRTDAGVHALAQVATFGTESGLQLKRIKGGLNALLPQDIRILNVSEVDESYHPRHNARRKSYFYLISNHTKSSAFLYRYTWGVKQPLDVQSIIDAAQCLIGKHNFSSFQGTGSDIRNPVREIFSLKIEKFDEIDFMTASMKGNFIKITMEADGFLRHMARNIVGTLIEIGRGRMASHRMEEILQARNRRLAGPNVPPNGLFLEKIFY
jgi:tRNA pseudouridine38-40 synthase